MNDYKKYEIWVEGFQVTGQSSRAQKIGEIKANSFLEACRKLCGKMNDYSEETRGINIDTGQVVVKRNNPHIWGCKLFDNEKDARRNFG